MLWSYLEQRTTLLYRKEDRFDDGARSVLLAQASTTVSPFNFGYPYSRTTFNSYLMRDGVTGSYDFFHPYIWNHLCFSWGQGKPSTLMLVMICWIYLLQSILSYLFQKCITEWRIPEHKFCRRESVRIGNPQRASDESTPLKMQQWLWTDLHNTRRNGNWF